MPQAAFLYDLENYPYQHLVMELKLYSRKTSVKELLCSRDASLVANSLDWTSSEIFLSSFVQDLKYAAFLTNTLTFFELSKHLCQGNRT